MFAVELSHEESAFFKIRACMYHYFTDFNDPSVSDTHKHTICFIYELVVNC